ncbi:FMN-binding protein [Eubacterium multiforme]|uniref:Uncharacterized protein with FMN-binding domain n=1 Tax=Eubacterium multiforme TaxID=83339 RepID=A0ABT9UTE8_9FIRM|nr:FMN-binding protein [Eubacterium multiforme]MDQ0149565.1 uncharacterized protein with FMN-binding domain [Eubacterium multiforme]
MKNKNIIIGGLFTTIVVGAASFAVVDPYNMFSKKNTLEVSKENQNAQDIVIKDKEEEKKEDKKEEDQKAINLSKVKDGTYFGASKGYGGEIKVKVTIEDSKIKNVEVVSHSETPQYYENGKKVIDNILNSNSTNVDSISGATLTSNGIKNAVRDAISKAGIKVTKVNEDKIVNNNSNTNSETRGVSLAKKNIDRYLSSGKINTKEHKLKDGEYIGEAPGFRGNIKVKTIIKNGKLADIKVISNSDDYEYLNNAKGVIHKILKNNGTEGVDTVSGATYSSRGIIDAINRSLKKAIKKDGTMAKKDTKENHKKTDSKPETKPTVKPETKPMPKPNTEDSNKKYNDGKWIGTGSGFKAKTVGDNEVEVEIKDGKIVSIEIKTFNDDEGFDRKVRKLFDKIIKNNSTGKMKEDFSKVIDMGLIEKEERIEKLKAKMANASDKDERIKDYEVVSGATYSSRGIIEAINNALSKSERKLDDSVRKLTIVKKPSATAVYGEPIDLSKVELSITYKDLTEKRIKFSELKENGIDCNIADKAIINPKDKRLTGMMRVPVTFTHRASGAAVNTEIQLSKKRIYKELGKIKFIRDNKTEEIIDLKGSNNKFAREIKLEDGKDTDFTKIEVYDANDKLVTSTSKWNNNKTMCFVDVEQLKEETESTMSMYPQTGYRVEFLRNISFDSEKIKSFEISSLPKKLDYLKGEKLDLSGLSIIVTDSNRLEKNINIDKLEMYGFKVAPQHDSELKEAGNIKININHKNKEVSGKNFEIKVKDKLALPHKIELRDSENDELVETVLLEKDKRVYNIKKLQKKYETSKNPLKVKILLENGDVFTAKDIKWNKKRDMATIELSEDGSKIRLSIWEYSK